MNNDILIPADVLAAFGGHILAAAGCSDDEGRRIADRLVAANLTGHDSHGISRIPRYVQHMGIGLVFPGRSVTTVRDDGNTLVLDGDSGFGQIVGEAAVALGCERAHAHGTAVVTLRNSGHLGRIGDWAEDAAARGLISIHMVSVRGRSLAAPFGGIDRRLATSPFCAGVPLSDDDPLVLDFATSRIAEGKALVGAVTGAARPAGSFVDAEGRPSADPADLYGATTSDPVPNASAGRGALAAFGDHKGSGLSIMIEVLAGALSGAGVSMTLADRMEAPFRNAMLSIYLDPDRFAGRAYVESEVRAWIAYVKSARPAAGHDDVLVPGEKERRLRAKRLRDGVPLADGIWRRLVDVAAQSGVPDNAFPAVVAA